MAELGTEVLTRRFPSFRVSRFRWDYIQGSIDGNQRLVIRGKYVPKYIESLVSELR